MSGNNNELRLRLNEKLILPDFIDTNLNKIIEFDGTYWHKVKNKNYSFDNNPDIKRQKLIKFALIINSIWQTFLIV